MVTVEIEYCVPCGHLDRAQTVQHELLEDFGLEIDGVTLTTGTDGVFTISVNGQKVYDKETDGHLDIDKIKESIAATA